ncbi:MAG TPA: hypothetical protein VKF38_11590 [Anaerolineaceae bacterium]|nr:hypothetical protein [Anaerolineaceae bacterium]
MPISSNGSLQSNLHRSWKTPKSIAWLFTLPVKTTSAILTIAMVLLGLFCYFWYISSGQMVLPHNGTDYFDLQAQGYLKGQLSLPVQPDPRLLAMANPYDYKARGNLPVLWDASLYQGHYYLYWGPTPAILAAVVKLVHPRQVTDADLVLLFESVTLIFGASLISHLRSRLFPDLPGWIILPPLIMLGFANPLLYILNRPSVYEAAITGGQAFLIVGLFFAILSIDGQTVRTSFLALAGICWAFSIGSRQDLIPAIAFLSIGTAIYILKFAPKEIHIRAMIVLGFPLALGVIGLGGYDMARFGSVLETGHNYQLTGVASPAKGHLIISPGYILPNFYNYLFRPIQLSSKFPFLSAPKVKQSQWPFFIRLIAPYSLTEPVIGILWTLPFGLFALVPVLFQRWSMVWRTGRGQIPSISFRSHASDTQERLFRWLFWGLAGTILLTGGLLLVYITASMRYELDVLPLMAILAFLGFAWGYQLLGSHRKLHRVYVCVAVILLLYTLIVGLLLGFTGYNNHFQTVNPDLFVRLTNFFPKN